MTCSDFGLEPDAPASNRQTLAPSEAIVTIIIGDGRTRASAHLEPRGEGRPSWEILADFEGMTVAEALRRNWFAKQTHASEDFRFHLDDRGGAVSLLDIAEAFTELTDQARRLQPTRPRHAGDEAFGEMRGRLIEIISLGRVY